MAKSQVQADQPAVANSQIARDTVVVVLAAGKGTRMGRNDLGKVCFDIDAVPAINRQIRVFQARGFSRFLLVVGARAEKVMETVTREFPGVFYVHQEPQLGTGHAAKLAAEALDAFGFRGNVLVTMGDKYLEPTAIDALLGGFIKQQADMALLVVPPSRATQDSMGRVLINGDGQALAILERTDRARLEIAEALDEMLATRGRLTGATVRQLIDAHLPDRKRQARAVGPLLELAECEGPIDAEKLAAISRQWRDWFEVDGKRYGVRQIRRLSKYTNPSLYLFRDEAFSEGVRRLDNDNAQGEYYLTDVVRHLAQAKGPDGRPRFRVRAVPVEHPEWIQGFNSPDELLAIQDYLRRKKPAAGQAAGTAARPQLKPNQYATVQQWLQKIQQGRGSIGRWLRRIYGDHADLHEAKLRDLARALECYGRRFGFEEKVAIVRAPGRVNLMGRHVDHRGGTTNFLAIDRETVAVAGLRQDDRVVAVNVEPARFKPVEFSIGEVMGRFAFSDWLNFIESPWVKDMLRNAVGNWGNYLKAAVLRLQHRYPEVKVQGINLAVSGNVPMAAGLSSSSTLVVAALQAAIALNNFELTSQQFVDLCGEGEWFVGSRGGAGDHAAIYLGQRNKIAHVGYLPFRVEKTLDAPRDYQVVIANSHIRAAKSAGSKHQFNARIADYNLGLALLKQRCPEIAGVVEYLRDIDPEKLGCPTSTIYRWLLKVPAVMRRKDFQTVLSREHRDLVAASFASHDEPAVYHPRGVLLFGIAEILRSRLAVGLLESGRIEEFGQLMRISHDGDRVSRPGMDGNYRPVEEDTSDAHLNRLIEDLASEDPQRVLDAQLYRQPGSYACSTPEIDRMVDIASRVPGVAGAQIAGAGLGGCIMILARKEAVQRVRRALVRDYYKPAGLKPAVLACTAVEGAGLVEF
ncbi:MAG: NTP transferase domain-containing protein [Pirellulales bacterium]|nr:NTP transferase domain-containing protein [Pirellulales bacterium]